MPCYGCASKFTIFNKENGCPQCGFSYCNKCLKYKAVIPKLGNAEHLVCKSCHIALTAIHARSAQKEHSAPSLQRIVSLESPPRAPITIYRHNQRIQQLKSGLTQTDREIAERLEKLKEDRKREPLPSEEEIANRLAMLKGENPLQHLNKESKIFAPVAPRSEQEQADDLLNQFIEEQQLELNQATPAEDITARLAQLRGTSQSSETASTNVNPVSEIIDSFKLDDSNTLLAQDTNKELESSAKTCVDEVRSMLKKKSSTKQTDRPMSISDPGGEEAGEQEVLKKILEEAALEEKLELSDDSGEAEIDNEELPWCIICNENAKLRCIDCCGDLYCESCFQQGHNEFDMKDHKSVAYQPNTKK